MRYTDLEGRMRIFLTRDPAGGALMLGKDHWILDRKEVEHSTWERFSIAGIPDPVPCESALQTAAKQDDNVSMHENDQHMPGSINHYHGVELGQPNMYTYVNLSPGTSKPATKGQIKTSHF